jgi:hypothetical protein
MILIHTRKPARSVAATNALYLAQLATSTHNDRLLRNATSSYSSALRLLRRDLSKPKACFNDYVFDTIYVISLYKAFKGIAIDDAS